MSCNTCLTCKHWDASEEKVSWNEQHKNDLEFDYKEYGECNSPQMLAAVFRGKPYFGNYTHKSFGCIFHELKNK